MSPARRSSRRVRSMDDEDGDGGMDSPTGGKSISGAVPGLTPLRPGHVSELPQEIETESSVLMSTPQAGGSSSTLLGTPTSSRTFTRPTLKGYFNSILVENPSSRSQAQDRLRFAIAREGVSATISSHLEEARDIHYEPIEADDIDVQEPQDDESGENSHPTVGGLRIPRRSDRIRAKNGATREPSPSTALAAVSKSTNNRVQKRRKKTVIKTNLGTGTLRRSARLAKPLDVFHKYPELPEELKLMVWEAAIQPRLTYICNRSSILGHAHSFGIQNKFPTWFMACQASVWVAMRCYKKLFGQKDMSIHPSIGMTLRPQAINTQVDIVVFEPCHNGCRGYYCAQQYSREDRDTVERLAVQIDSPHLPPGSEPGWATISKSWPGVETLFMMKPAVKGLDQSDKAMIRIKEGDHELALRKGFEAWKKDAGKSSKLTTLEFVRIVEQEPDTKKLQDRYQSVEDRKTGSVEDIILG